MLTGDCAIRGGLTLADGTAVKPVSANSLSSCGSSFDERLTLSASDSTAAFTTNSPVDSMFRSVSFLVPSCRSVGENTTTGGLALNVLKKLNGARFTTPVVPSDVTHAIGRGVTVPIMP